jgi:hypothetical protein
VPGVTAEVLLNTSGSGPDIPAGMPAGIPGNVVDRQTLPEDIPLRVMNVDSEIILFSIVNHGNE